MIKQMKQIVARGRIHELDLLRGFFIVIIVLDHMQRWPSPFQYVTGQGRLWVTAAEGFFIISGLLIGYLRAYKQQEVPLKVLTKKLLKRAAMLYVWGVGITLFINSITVLLPGDGSLLPKLPDGEQVASIQNYLWAIFTTSYANDWIYFLRLYAIMLAITPLFLWLLRKKLWWVVVSIMAAVYIGSLFIVEAEAAMQWQLLFFGAALIGYKFEDIVAWFRRRPKRKVAFFATVIGTSLITMVLSYFFVFGWNNVESGHGIMTYDQYVGIRAVIDPWFSSNPLTILRISLAFLWFTGLLCIFHLLKPFIQKVFGWLLMEFGTYSLTSYCLQAIFLGFIQTLVPLSTSWIINFLVSCLFIVLFWALLKIKFIKRVLPQ